MLALNNIAFTPTERVHSGLGNQLYNYAALMGIASMHGYDYCVPLVHPECPTPGVGRFMLVDCFDLPGITLAYAELPMYHNPSFNFNPALFLTCQDNVSLCGCFFSDKYFNHIEKDIRKTYTFKPHILEECVRVRSTVTEGDVIAVQIRRGDYSDPYWNVGICKLEYYLEALRNIYNRVGKKPVFIFSDDPLWCMSALQGNQYYFIVDRMSSQPRCHGNPNMHKNSYTEESINIKNRNVIWVTDHIRSLCLMSLCNHFIISNSTYGIWGAWLAKDKGLSIRPRLLWSLASSEAASKDYYPNGWESLPAW